MSRIESLETRNLLTRVEFIPMPPIDPELAENSSRAPYVASDDFNGDGLIDVVFGSESGLQWYRNDGAGLFSKQIISDRWPILHTTTGDFDADGDVDVLASQDRQAGRTLVLFENVGDRFAEVELSNTSTYFSEFSVGDIDQDADIDALFIQGNELWWLENNETSNPELHRVAGQLKDYDAAGLIDLELDGDLDIIAFDDDEEGEVLTFADGRFSSTYHWDTNAEWSNVLTADIDGDGDLDGIARSAYERAIVWYETKPDEAPQLFQRRIQSGHRHSMVSVVDIDNDGDELLLNQLQVLPYDVNFDGVFDSSDLVTLFQIGEYEDGISRNSIWSDGDWNHDGDFTSSDLVLAFAAGVYVDD